MTGFTRKRAFAGPSIQELRKVDQVPLHLPPHKKPKVWTLVVEWTSETTMRRTKKFSSRVSRDLSRARIERELKEIAERELLRKPLPYGYLSDGDRFSGYDDLVVAKLRNGPVFTEGYESE